MMQQREPDPALEEDALGEIDDEETGDFTDFEDDESEEERLISPALLVILALGGFGIGIILTSLTFTSVMLMTEYVGDWAWILVPVPLLLFSWGAIWQYERGWLQQLGAAALGFSLAQYLMYSIGRLFFIP